MSENPLSNYLANPGGDRSLLVSALAGLGMLRSDASQDIPDEDKSLIRANIGAASAVQGSLAETSLQPGDVGTGSGQVAAGDDTRFRNSLTVPTVGELATTPTSASLIRTSSHNLTSKLGQALYKRVGVQPAHNLWEPADGGGFWDISEPTIDLTMVGAIGDATSGTSGYDNGTVLQDAFGYASLLGGTIFVPRGMYRTTLGVTVTMPDVKKVPGISGEGKGASCFVMGTGTFTILKFESCARAVIEKIGFYKDAATDGGFGLALSRIPWSRIMDVSTEGVEGAGGFERGVYLQNCLSSTIDLTSRDNVYGLYADYLVDPPHFASRPNALIIRGNYGRNKRWGIRIDEPSQMDLMAQIEGNGWGVSDAFRGGLYIPNAGTEGGSIDIHNCYFELNAGTADIWAPQVINPGTCFNIIGNYFANLENPRSVVNHINIENAIKVNYNIIGNKFDSLGSYTPSASKRAITAAAPDAVKINLGGDDQQFTHAVEWPSAFGAMGLRYGGRVNADGSVPSGGMPDGWSASRTGVGSYLITLPSYLSLSHFAFTATANSVNSVKVERTLNSGGNLLVLVTDTANAAADGGFDWSATGIR